MFKYVFRNGTGYRIVEAETPQQAFLSMGYNSFIKLTISKTRIFCDNNWHISQFVRSGTFFTGGAVGHESSYHFHEIPVDQHTDQYIKSIIR